MRLDMLRMKSRVLEELTCVAKAVGHPSVSPRYELLARLIRLIQIAVNAASKGHLPVVLYLLTKQSADPLVRNNWGETAYDAAAAVFEVWICEVRRYLDVCFDISQSHAF